MKRNILHSEICNHVKRAMHESSSYRAATLAMECLDLTSLTGHESEKDIDRLCKMALNTKTAAICVYPKFLERAYDQLKGSCVRLATVINFPNGSQTNEGELITIETVKRDITDAIAKHADEIDMVVDFEKFKSMDANSESAIRVMIETAKKSCGDDVPLKVILETAAFGQETEIYDLATIALESGADFVKTSTGKHEDGGATPDAVAAMAFAVRDYNSKYKLESGIKISGGVNGQNYAQYIELIRLILGRDALQPLRFRIGASSLYDDLKMTIETKGQVKSAPLRTMSY